MSTEILPLLPGMPLFPSTNFPQAKVVQGTNFPVFSLCFDATTEEACYFCFQAVRYGSGNLTLRIQWEADSATSGDVKFGGSLAAITPNTDSQDIETKAFATEVTNTDTHLGTTGQRLHEFTITVSNLDSIAAGDWCVIKLARKAADGADTMTGDCQVVGLQLEYSNT